MNILITGASRGIGRAAARLRGERGWNVGINYASNEAAASEAVQEVEDAGGKAVMLQGNVSQEQDVMRMCDEMEQHFGAINRFVINAGITAQSMRLADMSVERLRKVFDTNVLGSYLCAREAARRLPAHSSPERTSNIVIVSSAAARLGAPSEYVDYAGSKGAMDTLTTGLAKELGPDGIRVNAVRPGIIDTDIHASPGDPDRLQRIGNQTPLQRPGTARETAEAMVWLLSPAASYVTGTHIHVTEGR